MAMKKKMRKINLTISIILESPTYNRHPVFSHPNKRCVGCAAHLSFLNGIKKFTLRQVDATPPFLIVIQLKRV